LPELDRAPLDRAVDTHQPCGVVGLRRARWLSAVLLAPVLLCALAASTTFGQRCRLTGMITLDACCPQASQSALDPSAETASSEPATLSDPGCCERLVITVAKVPGDASGPALECPTRSVTSGLATTPPLGDLPFQISGGASRRLARPPGAAPPAFLLGHSFLI